MKSRKSHETCSKNGEKKNRRKLKVKLKGEHIKKSQHSSNGEFRHGENDADISEGYGEGEGTDIEENTEKKILILK